MRLIFIPFIFITVLFNNCSRRPHVVNHHITKLCDSLFTDCGESTFRQLSRNTTVAKFVALCQKNNEGNLYGTDHFSIIDTTRRNYYGILMCDSTEFLFQPFRSEDEMQTSQLNGIIYFFENEDADETEIIMDSMQSRLITVFNGTDKIDKNADDLKDVKEPSDGLFTRVVYSYGISFLISSRHNNTLLLTVMFK